jgi:hypothetical protein
MDQMVSNRVWWGGARSCMEKMVSDLVWNRWCQIVYETDGARSCMKQMHGKYCAMQGTDGSGVV